MTTRRRRSNKRRTMSAGGGKLPTSEAGAIKRAKKALQALVLNTDTKKANKLLTAAREAVKNADERAKDRKDWRAEILINSNEKFSTSIGSSRWYGKVNLVEKWGITDEGAVTIPYWAHMGNEDPAQGEMIEGMPYTNPIPSKSR